MTADGGEVSPGRVRARNWGGLAWLLCLQFFVAEWISIALWRGQYSLSTDFISDLGAGCPLPGTAGCAGWPALMNGSFVLQGLLIEVGALLLWREARGLSSRVGFVFAGLSAPGVLLVGVFPEDVAPAVHYDAAALHFVSLTVAASFFAAGLAGDGRSARPYALLSLVAAITGASGSALLGLHVDLGLGFGSVERLVAYPFPIWLASLGYAYRRGHLR